MVLQPWETLSLVGFWEKTFTYSEFPAAIFLSKRQFLRIHAPPVTVSKAACPRLTKPKTWIFFCQTCEASILKSQACKSHSCAWRICLAKSMSASGPDKSEWLSDKGCDVVKCVLCFTGNHWRELSAFAGSCCSAFVIISKTLGSSKRVA